METLTKTDELIDVESFRLRAREWIAANLPPAEKSDVVKASESKWPRAREIQKLLHSGGFAGLCYPKEYGGQGLTRAHQVAFREEAAGYELPVALDTPSLSICGPTILDMGTEEQKKRHLPAVIRGDEVLVQFLSEPTGGSDLAGATMRATRDGDVFILNGSKTWSSGAYAADYALCLARTDWDAPKHRGLTMFLVKVDQPGIAIRPIKQTNGNSEFCEEFFDNVEVPIENVVGEINGGWAVASRQLFHEKNAVGGGSLYVTGNPVMAQSGSPAEKLIDMARRTGSAGDSHVRGLIAESHAIAKVQLHLIDRIMAGMRTDNFSPPSVSIIRLFSGQGYSRQLEIALEVAGSQWMARLPGDAGEHQNGEAFIDRQANSLAGGSTEMARNIISERVLGMPREYAADRDVPFNEIRRGR